MLFQRRPTRLSLLSAVLLASSAALSHAADWPQWRGPAFNGSTTETGLPPTFGPEENVLWSAPLPGPSGSTPVVWGTALFVSSVDAATEPRGLVALCVDTATGAVRWRHAVTEDRQVTRNTMASPSPVTDGQRVFFLYGTGALAAFSMDGNLLWRRDLEADHGHNALMFGYSSSPLLHAGRLIIQAIRHARQDRYGKGPAKPAESYLLAIDPDTGKDLWLVQRPDTAIEESQEAYTTPIPYARPGGQTEILVLGGDCLTGHSPDTGAELWRWETYNPRQINHWRVVSSPVTAGELAIICGPKHSDMFAIRPGSAGSLGAQHVAWTFPKAISDASTPLLYGERLYVLDDDRRTMTCLIPATGEQKWQMPLTGRGVFRSSPLGADGRVFCIDEGAEVFVLAAGDEPALLHRVKMDEDRACRSSLIAAHGRLYIRTSNRLFCIGSPPAEPR